MEVGQIGDSAGEREGEREGTRRGGRAIPPPTTTTGATHKIGAQCVCDLFKAKLSTPKTSLQRMCQLIGSACTEGEQVKPI